MKIIHIAKPINWKMGNYTPTKSDWGTFKVSYAKINSFKKYLGGNKSDDNIVQTFNQN